MKINKLGFLSLLAIPGIIGILTEHKELMSFLVFAYYIRYFFVTPDEMFQQNVRIAASIGFFSGIGATGIAILLRLLLPALISSNIALAACYVVSMFCFTLALVILEFKELRGC